jgi:hypothetical protein
MLDGVFPGRQNMYPLELSLIDFTTYFNDGILEIGVGDQISETVNGFAGFAGRQCIDPVPPMINQILSFQKNQFVNRFRIRMLKNMTVEIDITWNPENT